MIARKVFARRDWDRIGCKIIRVLFFILLLPVSAVYIASTFVSAYLSDFIDWMDDRIESVCWYYVKWRKGK